MSRHVKLKRSKVYRSRYIQIPVMPAHHAQHKGMHYVV